MSFKGSLRDESGLTSERSRHAQLRQLRVDSDDDKLMRSPRTLSVFKATRGLFPTVRACYVPVLCQHHRRVYPTSREMRLHVSMTRMARVLI